jgi:hypothetical protein
LLSAQDKAAVSSLNVLNDYIKKHYDRLVEHESLERRRIVASFAEKEQSYERQISRQIAACADVAALLAREQSTNNELRQKLDIAAGSITILCKLVTDGNSVFVNHKLGPHQIKQEEGASVSGTMTFLDAAISPLLSQIETIVTGTNANAGLPSPVDPSSCHFLIEALGKIADSLLATQRSFALQLEDYKAVDADRVETGCENVSLRAEVALLQEELKQVKNDKERISHELAVGAPVFAALSTSVLFLFSVRLEREKHTCPPPTSTYSTPIVPHSHTSAAHVDFSASLPSPPLEKRGSPPKG